MPIQYEGDRLGDLLKWENPHNYFSREKVIIRSGQNLAMGTVIRKSEDGKVVIVDENPDGAVEVYGFLIADYDASASDVEGVAIVRDALIIPERLVLPEGMDINDVIGPLRELDIIPREEA